MTADYSELPDVELSARAEQGDDWALKEIGLREFNAGNTETALTWWHRSADLGNHAAMRNLGITAQQQGDWETAKFWLTKAVDAGSDSSCLHLGQMFHLRTVDLDKAKYWYERGVGLGETGCMNNLGILAESAGDTDEAASWYRRAADLGEALSMANLARVLLRRGDEDGCVQWLARAIDADDEEAIAVIESVRKQLRKLRKSRTQEPKKSQAIQREKPVNDFMSKCRILGEVWINYRDDEAFEDFIEYNDVGLPLAYCLGQAFATAEPKGEEYVNETWELLLEALGVDGGRNWQSLEQMLENADPEADELGES